MALALAIVSLTIVGLLVAASFFVAVREQRMGRNSLRLEQAFDAAESGTADVVNHWSAALNQLAIGSQLGLSRTEMPNGAGWYRGSVQRISATMFLALAEGFSKDSSSRQRVGQLLQLRPPELGLRSALEVRGPLQIGGSAGVSGVDNSPAGWPACSTTQPGVAAVRIGPNDSITVTAGGCGGACLTGQPAVFRDSTLPVGSAQFGQVTWSQLTLLAGKTIPVGSGVLPGPRITAGQCDLAALENWGDPGGSGVCASYLPVVLAPGDLRIDGGLGQGILLVEGDLTIGGGFEFAGLIVVRGKLTMESSGSRIIGGVVASGAELLDPQSFKGSWISYSSCVLNRVLKGSARGVPLRERSWFHAF